MKLQLYNTPDRRIVDFHPITPGQVSLYCCGPTVYNFAHIGNLRSYLFEDLLRRTLELAGYRVKHVMNVTDVGHLTDDGDDGEDKMVKSARERGLSVWDISQMFAQAFFKDTERLNILQPQVVCKATDHVGDMIAMVQGLEKGGFTYQSGGNVYFNTQVFPAYGQMALLDKQTEPAESRVELDPHKRHPRDFVLWFTNSKFDGQAMVWDSPWGKGYPGWHIECSAMSIKYLGDRFDIHCGGVDHIPVHHTNEIAQSEAFCGHKWVNYWIHGEFLLLQKNKMSKSGGGFLTLQVLMDQGYDPLDYRFFCFSGHYRTQLTFTFEALDGARSGRKNLNERVLALKKGAGAPHFNSENPNWKGFCDALSNDLNAPQALAQVWALVKDDTFSREEKLGVLYSMDQVLGLGLQALEASEEEIPHQVRDLLEQRKAARMSKDWLASDRIRGELAQLGWIVEDGPGGQKIKKGLPV